MRQVQAAQRATVVQRRQAGVGDRRADQHEEFKLGQASELGQVCVGKLLAFAVSLSLFSVVVFLLVVVWLGAEGCVTGGGSATGAADEARCCAA